MVHVLESDVDIVLTVDTEESGQSVGGQAGATLIKARSKSSERELLGGHSDPDRTCKSSGTFAVR